MKFFLYYVTNRDVNNEVRGDRVDRVDPGVVSTPNLLGRPNNIVYF